MVAPAGAGPWPHRTIGVGRRPRSPRWPAPRRPGPLRCGSTTCSTKPAATAASKALPPASSSAIADWLSEPVRRGHHAEGAPQGRPGGERHDLIPAAAAGRSWPGDARRARCRPSSTRWHGDPSPATVAQRGHLGRALVERERAPGVEPAAGRRVERGRAGRRRAAPGARARWRRRVGDRRGREQRLRVRVAGAAKIRSRGALLDELAEVHDGDRRRRGTPPRTGRG